MGLFGFGKKEKDKMKDGLEKTRTGFWGNILNTLTGSKIDDDLYDSLEEQLILADVGGEVAIKLVDKLRDRVNEKGLKTGEQAADELRDLIAEERPKLAAGLRALGLYVVGGRANYLLFQAPADFGEALRRRGAVVRSCANYPGLVGSWYRTAVRTNAVNQKLLQIMGEVLA